MSVGVNEIQIKYIKPKYNYSNKISQFCVPLEETIGATYPVYLTYRMIQAIKGVWINSQVEFRFHWDLIEKFSVSDLLVCQNLGMIHYMVGTQSSTLLS